MGNYGAKYVGYAQNAVNCGVECVYFAIHTTHILKDLDFAFPLTFPPLPHPYFVQIAKIIDYFYLIIDFLI